MNRTDSLAANIAVAHNALANCQKINRQDMAGKWQSVIDTLERDALPHGSGIDAGTKIESVTDTKIVLLVSFHTMDENGFYCGWRDYRVHFKAAFNGHDIHVTGRDFQGLKDYLGDLYNHVLNEPAPDSVHNAIESIFKN